MLPSFSAISIAEKHHEERFRKILDMKCGYLHIGEEPPERCPSCSHSKNYFEVRCEKY